MPFFLLFLSFVNARWSSTALGLPFWLSTILTNFLTVKKHSYNMIFHFIKWPCFCSKFLAILMNFWPHKHVNITSRVWDIFLVTYRIPYDEWKWRTIKDGNFIIGMISNVWLERQIYSFDGNQVTILYALKCNVNVGTYLRSRIPCYICHIFPVAWYVKRYFLLIGTNPGIFDHKSEGWS